MRIVAIDPGTEKSAWVDYDPDAHGGPIHSMGIEENSVVLERIRSKSEFDNFLDAQLVIEMVQSYGMPVGKEVFETVFWIGRFFQGHQDRDPRKPKPQRIYRSQVKQHLNKSAKGNDATIRQALIDRFGPGRAKAIGLKANPGPLYGVKKDLWAALAVAVTFHDQEQKRAND